MIDVLLAGIIVFFAVLAIETESPVFCAIAFEACVILVSLFFLLLGAVFAGLFELTTGTGTVAILLLSGEMQGEPEPTANSKSRRTSVLLLASILGIAAAMGTYLGAPLLFIPQITVDFGTLLWINRSMDLLIQGMLMLVTGIGIIFVIVGGRQTK